MRRSQDLPVDRPRRRISGRGILIALGGLFLFVLIFGRAIARFYVDLLWHRALGRSDVFWGVIGAKFTLFAIFFLIFAILAGVNLFIADRTAPTSFPANVHPYVERFHEVFGQRLRLVRYASALVVAVFVALPAVAQWQSWLLFRNSKSFGTSDPQFGADVGFYVFQLPFLTFLLDWLFVAVILTLLFSAAAHVLNGGVVFVSPVPAVRNATKAHMAVLLAVLAVLKAGDYWLDRYELTNSTRGIVDGATYSVVKAQIPAIMLLILIALLTSALYLSVIKTNSWRLPFLASALWLVVSIVGGVIYPAVVQSLVVNPNQESREQLYIARNVDATKQALGLTDIEVRDVQFGTLTASEVEADIEPLTNVRLLNPIEMKDRFLVDRGEVAGLSIEDLDVDRYEIDGETEQVLVAARELDLGGVTNTSWQGLHLINTRWVRAGGGAGQQGAGQPATRLSHDRTRTPRVVLQPHVERVRHREHGVERARMQRSARLRRPQWCPDEFVRASRGVRPRVPRLQHHRLRCHRQRLPDALGARRQRPSPEVGTVPVVRRRSVSRLGRWPGGVGDRRLHDDEQVSLRSVDRRGPAFSAVWSVEQRQLRAQQRQGGRRRLHR